LVFHSTPSENSSFNFKPLPYDGKNMPESTPAQSVQKTFSVELEKEALIFSAAHFITFADADGNAICESIHGHNYRLACRVHGLLDEHACVIDFIWLRDQLKEIAATLDHHVLLAESHPQIKVEKQGSEFHVRFQERRWVFPEADVALLPMDNTTAERLAEYVGQCLMDRLQKLESANVTELQVGVDENEGQWAWCSIPVG